MVEDNISLLEALAKLLRNIGYTVTATNNGADALCLLFSQVPADLVLLDLMLPGLDGYQLMKRLGPAAPPVILMSGAEIRANEFDEKKVIRVLKKPFEMPELVEAIRCGIKAVESKEQVGLITRVKE